MIILDATTKKIELITGSAGDVDFFAAWADQTSSAFTPGATDGNITTATTTDIVAAPAASTQRLVKYINITNKHATAGNAVTVQIDVSGANRIQRGALTLAPSESLIFTESMGWTILDKNGKMKTVDLQKSVTGLSKFLYKTGTGADAAAYWYCSAKDAGIPGAWAPGTPGAAGRATDGLAAGDAGCVAFPDAGAGLARYLTQVDLTATVVEAFFFMDILWVNSGLSVTTTTAQNVNSVALPARDDDGSINGKGCMIGLLAVAALGNAAAVSNSTISYTNQAGTAGRTATLAAVAGAQIPATPVIGTVVWFQLQAGDQGVKSIETITLNTTLTSGTMSLIIARPLAAGPQAIVNQSFTNRLNNGGVRLYDRACIHAFYQAANTTVLTLNSLLTTEER